MNWEQRTIAISLALIVILVVWQTLGIFGVADEGFFNWVTKWQTLIASITAALLAIGGVAWQISVARLRDEKARQGAVARWKEEAEAAIERDRAARLESVRQKGHAVLRDLGRIISRCDDHGRLKSAVGSRIDSDILAEIRALSWSTANLDHWAPTFRTFGPIARDLYKVTDAYEPLRREVEILVLTAQTSAHDQEAIDRLFSDRMTKLVGTAREDTKAAMKELKSYLTKALPDEFPAPSIESVTLSDLVASFGSAHFSPGLESLAASTAEWVKGISTSYRTILNNPTLQAVSRLNQQYQNMFRNLGLPPTSKGNED